MRRQLRSAFSVLSAFLGLSALVLSISVTGIGSAQAQSDEADLWARLKTGKYIILIRHAETEPGVGDPDGFNVDNCSTQRNLSAIGRAHSQRLGAVFKTRGIPVGQVLSSRWCRCVDTARLAFGKVTPNRMLDSIFNDRSRDPDEKAREVARFVQQPVEGGNLVMVSHNYNISALTGVSTSQGEMVVATAGPGGKLQVVGRLSVP